LFKVGTGEEDGQQESEKMKWEKKEKNYRNPRVRLHEAKSTHLSASKSA